jgi:hypothetical protein
MKIGAIKLPYMLSANQYNTIIVCLFVYWYDGSERSVKSYRIDENRCKRLSYSFFFVFIFLVLLCSLMMAVADACRNRTLLFLSHSSNSTNAPLSLSVVLPTNLINIHFGSFSVGCTKHGMSTHISDE